jgi:hypothetical protein
MKTRWISGVVVAGAILSVLSCESSRVAAPAATASAGARTSLLGSRKLACPTKETLTTSADVGPLGGVISIGGTSISVPAGALLSPVTMTVTVPASNYMEVDISVAGYEPGTFPFQTPATVTVSYDRCSVSPFDAPFTAWWWDSTSKTLIEPMPSVDNRLLQTVTFTTPHLTGFILAN